MERFTLVIDDDTQFEAYKKARETFLDYLSGESNNDVGSALDFAFKAWLEAQDIKILGPTDTDKPLGSLVMSLTETEYSDWLESTEKGWRQHVDDTGIDFAMAIDSGIEEGLKFIGVEVYADHQSPVRDKAEAPAPEPTKPAGRFSGRKAANTEALPTRKAKATNKPKPATRKRAAKALAPAVSLNGKGHIGLANGSAAHA
jgi:hypothetical protein